MMLLSTFEEKASFQQLSIYRITEFSFKSNLTIDEFIENNKNDLESIVEQDDYIGIINYFLTLVSENELSEMEDYKLENLGTNPLEYKSIIENWISGLSIPDLIEVWKNTTDLDVIDFHIFISRALYYLYPWGISSFLIILAYKIQKEFDEPPDNIKNLTSYIKFGLNNGTSCLARSLGIKSRQVSLFLFNPSNQLQGKQFIRWISNLTSDEIESFEISKFDKENLKEISLKLTPSSYRSIAGEYDFIVKGTSFNTEWSITSLEVKIGDILSYEREEQNEYDPFAIIILKNENPIGYIPREYSKLISSEIDIEEKKFRVIASDIKENINHNDVKIHMSVDF